MPDNMAICSACGTITSGMQGRPQPPTNHGPYPSGAYDRPPIGAYGQGYPPQQAYPPPQQPAYMPPPQPSYGYGQPYGAPPMYQGPVQVNIIHNQPVASNTSSTPVLVEVLLSLFLGIYGVGWLMAGETTTGVILLICSFVLYWPILIIGVIFTLGLGLFCLGPLAIGAIILNAILLNNTLKRKATVQFMMAQPR